ncbi:MAG: methyltransferase domain-containing protein [Acidobacteria bacterium]|nr:methyltransferase domain-containing protein [Acidobacteriota bacterium]
MALTDLFGQNAIVRWLFGDTTRIDLAVTMTGVKLGERVLLAGCSDARLVVALGARSGMSGHVVAIDPDEQALRAVRTAAERAGVLIEVERAPLSMMPFETGSFDLVVVGSTAGAVALADTGAAFAEIARVLRPGGRAVVVQLAPRGGVVGSVQTTVGATSAPNDLRAAMITAGLKGVRVLAERDHLQFFEGGRGV